MLCLLESDGGVDCACQCMTRAIARWNRVFN